MTSVVKPLEYSKETILGMTTTLEQRFGCTPRNDTSATLNAKFGVQPSLIPTGQRLVKWFCWGVGGRSNDDNTLSSAQYVLGTNMGPYKIRPFVARPLENDLTILERVNYAMRQVRTIDGVPYVLYYLKAIDFTSSQVSYIRTDPTSGAESTYELDYANLTPTPPTADSNGTITDVADSISVVLPGTISITGQEVFESMQVIDGGDTRYSIVSELGFVCGAPQNVNAVDASGTQFSYSEAILAQMVDHYTWVGQPFLSTSDVFNRTIRFSARSLLVS